MNIDLILGNETEKPLDRLVEDGGFGKIFRTIACIGDSLSSGEFESLNDKQEKGYHDYFEYSWGQYMARDMGCKVVNYSRGGMSAKRFNNSYAPEHDCWAQHNACQAYIIALGVNDVSAIINNDIEFGDISDIDINNPQNNKDTFVGNYATILQNIKSVQPKARVFLMTIPKEGYSEEREAWNDKHQDLLYKLADMFDFTYVLDFRKYAPTYGEKFKEKFFLGGHLNAAGYVLTAKMTESYIDYIIRHNMDDFKQVGFIGTPYHNTSAKW